MAGALDLESVRCFVAVADAGSFRAAARRVALSPAAFSERIHRLEDDLGEPLLARTTRRTSLTAAGTRLLPRARRLLDDAAACRVVVREDAGELPYALTVGSRYELGLSWLLPAITPLSLAQPARTLHVYMGDTPDLHLRLDRGDVDAVVTSARLTLRHVEQATLHAEHYVFVGTTQRVSGPDDVRGLTLVDVSPDLPLWRYLQDALPDGAPWPFASVSYMGSIGAIRHRVLEGAGVAVLPAYFVAPDLVAGRLVQLLPDVTPRSDAFRLVWRRDHPRREALAGLAAELRAFPLR